MIELSVNKLSVILEVKNEYCVLNCSTPSVNAANSDHSALTESSRNQPGQHIIDSITDLRKILNAISEKIGGIQALTFDETFDETFN